MYFSLFTPFFPLFSSLLSVTTFTRPLCFLFCLLSSSPLLLLPRIQTSAPASSRPEPQPQVSGLQDGQRAGAEPLGPPEICRASGRSVDKIQRHTNLFNNKNKNLVVTVLSVYFQVRPSGAPTVSCVPNLLPNPARCRWLACLAPPASSRWFPPSPPPPSQTPPPPG